jgi:HEAT repeat protein
VLRDPSAAVRETAAWALGEMGVRAANPALGRALADRDAKVRASAAWALGQFHLARAPGALVKALDDPDRHVRLSAAWALGEIGDAEAAAAVADALRRETDEEVRRAEVRSLVESGRVSPEAVKGLLDSADAKTREMAVRALTGRHALSPWPWPRPRPRPFP